jgi:hypothetical protein
MRGRLPRRLSAVTLLLAAPLAAAGAVAISTTAASDQPGCTPGPVVQGTTVTETFCYTGSDQTWTVPDALTSATVTAWGAQGGSVPAASGNGTVAGGLGGVASTTLTGLTTGEVLTIMVGGQGGTGNPGAGGFNGGGAGGNTELTGSSNLETGGGGGASDIRLGGTTADDRVLVAGGGGGAGNACTPAQGCSNGGAGGGTNGQSATCACTPSTDPPGGGATPTSGGTAGDLGGGNATAGTSAQGGDGGVYAQITGGGGGGGGLYGGGGGGPQQGGGGGSGLEPAGSAFPAEPPAIPAPMTPGNLGNGSVVITFQQVVPIVTWPTPAAITYGSALSATQLDATASEPGTFAYNPPAGDVLDVGNHTLSVTYTPTDTIDDASVTSTTTLSVLRAPLEVIADNPTSVYSEPLPALGFTTSGLVNGDTVSSIGLNVLCTDTASATSDAGTYPITCTGPATTANYAVSYQPGALTILAAPSKLAASTVDLVSSVLGLSVDYSATLTSGVNGSPVANQTISFSIPSSLGISSAQCSAQTNAKGVATCSVSFVEIVPLVLSLGYDANFAGSLDYTPSSANGALTIP